MAGTRIYVSQGTCPRDSENETWNRPLFHLESQVIVYEYNVYPSRMLGKSRDKELTAYGVG